MATRSRGVETTERSGDLYPGCRRRRDVGDARRGESGVARRGRDVPGEGDRGIAGRPTGTTPVRFDGATNVVKIHLVSLTDRSHKSVQ
jgi:hypothetical protein